MHTSVLEQSSSLGHSEAPHWSPNEVMLSEQAQERREFDILASVYLLRADLQRESSIRPETWKRVFEEELTLVAEGINAPLTTTFEQRYNNGRLEAIDGTPLETMLHNGRQVALEQAQKDPRLTFHAFRAENDWQESSQLASMMAAGSVGDSIVSFSPYPEEAAQLHGAALLISKGYQPQRKLAFARLYHKVDADTLRATTISFDNSNLGAFRAVARQLGVDIPATATSDEFGRYLARVSIPTEQLGEVTKMIIQTYDTHLERQTGEAHNQGRKERDAVDAWQFIDTQRDLTKYYFSRLEAMAVRAGQDRGVEESAKKQLTIEFWATLKQRLDAYKCNPNGHLMAPSIDIMDRELHLIMEMQLASEKAARNFETLIACGGAIAANGSSEAATSLLDLSPGDLFTAIMTGEGSPSEELIWVDGYCRVEDCPTAPMKTKIAQCRFCKHCQALFDDGKDPRVVYKQAKRQRAQQKQQKPFSRSIIKNNDAK